MRLTTTAAFLLALYCPASNAQKPEANQDESKVGEYTLPDVLRLANGKQVTGKADWESSRRPEILRLFQTEVYGISPGKPAGMTSELTSIDKHALNGAAIRKQVTILLNGKNDGPQLSLLLYLPAKAKGPVPVFLGLNFGGNHTVQPDPGIAVTKSWVRTNPSAGITGNQASEKSRGADAKSWPVETILARGYGVATVYCGDIDPDYDDGFQNGVHPLSYKGNQQKPEADQWGTIGAWAWGLSRALDYLETDKDVDAKRVAVIGHSRLGKAALWAGAQDRRFALVISNESGEGGAALARRNFGETVKIINSSFPHWFDGNFKRYNDDVKSLPVDQHMLIALIAPRPVYIASAAGDLWSDPKGEYLSGYYAGPVYRLYGEKGLESAEMPEVDQPVAKSAVGYHIRSGKHAITPYDWEQYLDFADSHLR